MKHNTDGKARDCSAWDLYLVTGGLACGNCGATDVPALENRCKGQAADGPCPLMSEPMDPNELCWVHRAQRRSTKEAAS